MSKRFTFHLHRHFGMRRTVFVFSVSTDLLAQRNDISLIVYDVIKNVNMRELHRGNSVTCWRSSPLQQTQVCGSVIHFVQNDTLHKDVSLIEFCKWRYLTRLSALLNETFSVT